MARLPSNISLEKNEVSQTIDLKSLGLDASNRPDIREEIAFEIIELIRSRTEKGKDIGGNSFDRYSKDYKESETFAAYGKTNKVNMTLTGDMLAAIDIIESSDNKIKIGIVDDNAPKAYGHMTGMEGHKAIKDAPKRQFFGVTKTELENIASKYEDELEEEDSTLTAAAILSEINRLGGADPSKNKVTRIIDALFGDYED